MFFKMFVGAAALAERAVDKTVEIFSPVRAARRQYARKVGAFLDTSWKGASRTSRSIATWVPALSDPNVENNPYEKATLTARSRDAYRNQLIARAAVSRLKTNVVGTGLKLQSNIDFKTLGITKEQGAEVQKEIEREFKSYSEDCNEVDAERTLNFAGLQTLVEVSALLSGDCFVTTPFRERVGYTYGLKLQVIEADRVSNPNYGMNSKSLVDGVESDKLGAPLFYHIQKEHPANIYNFSENSQWEKIRVFGPLTGRRRVLHRFPNKDRPGQKRGIPFLAPILEPLKQLDKYSEAEIMAAVVSSMFTVFVKTASGQGLGQMAPDLTTDGNPAIEPNASAADEIHMGNGAVIDLSEGEEISTANPGRPNSQYEPFVMAIIKQIGAALEIPFEVLLLHFSSSFSAARAALIEAWKYFKVRRLDLARDFCQPAFELWLDEAVSRGRLSLPGYADISTRKAYSRARWVGDAREMIKALEGVKTAGELISLGLSDRKTEAAELKGVDSDDVHDQLTVEEARREKDGLKGVFPAPAAPEESEEEEDEQEDGEDKKFNDGL